MNVRTEPDLSTQENIVDVVTAGMVFDYYEVRKVGETDWFRIIEPKSEQMVWISGKTVAEAIKGWRDRIEQRAADCQNGKRTKNGKNG